MIDNNLENMSDMITDEINATYNLKTLKEVDYKYETIAHPHVGYRFGERYLINNAKKAAFKHLIQSCSLGLVNTNKWINTGYANSIGHCFYYLLTQYKYEEKYNPILSKIFANSYMFLSVCVNNMMEEAYDSCRTRGMLTVNFIHPSSDEIFEEYFGLDISLERNVMSIGDYFLACIGLGKYGKQKESDDCFKWANQLFRQIKDSYYFDIEPNIELHEFVYFSQKNSIKFANNLLKAYKLGVFNITDSEWSQIKNSQYQDKIFQNLKKIEFSSNVKIVKYKKRK
jgi:hypothetical protein